MSKSSSGDYLKRYASHPDHELLMWEKWVKIRNEEIKNLALRSDRPPVDLVMNQVDKFRERVEEDEILDKAYKNSRPGDAFWELPDRLHQRGGEGVYEVKKTKAELRYAEFIEHVHVPNAIQENEKGIAGASKRPTLTKLRAGYNEFKRIREYELKEDLKKFESHKPDIGELIVLNSAPRDIETTKIESESARLPVIVIDYCDNVPDSYNESIEGVYALKINSTIFKNRTQESEIFIEELENKNCYKKALTWTYYFNVLEKKIGREKIILQNLGTVTIKYKFERSQTTEDYTVLPIYSYNQCKQQFFFKKDEDMVTPGQTKEINITYFSNAPGIYEESWELKLLNVDFFKSSNEEIVINLVGETVEDIKTINKNIQHLIEEINLKANYLMIFNFLQEATTNAIFIKPETYPYKDYFLEADLFVTINPEYYYHQTLVQKLKEFFKEMTGDEWDLSVRSWREAVVAKEFNERMIYYDVLKHAHRDLLKPFSDNLDDLSRQKHRMVKFLMNNLVDKFYDERIRLTQAYGLADKFIQEPKEERFGGCVAVSPEEFINRSHSESSNVSKSSCITSTLNEDVVLSVFYLHIYEHLVTTVETCAGVLSSLDLNRYVVF